MGASFRRWSVQKEEKRDLSRHAISKPFRSVYHHAATLDSWQLPGARLRSTLPDLT